MTTFSPRAEYNFVYSSLGLAFRDVWTMDRAPQLSGLGRNKAGFQLFMPSPSSLVRPNAPRRVFAD